MRIKRNELVQVVFPMSAAIIFAQSASASYSTLGAEQFKGSQSAFSIGIADLRPVQNATTIPQYNGVNSDTNAGSAGTSLLAAAAPSTTSSDLSLATVREQLNILEQLLFDHEYLQQSPEDRLAQLEQLVFHSHQEGSYRKRLKNLIAALPADTRARVTTAIAKQLGSAPDADPLAHVPNPYPKPALYSRLMPYGIPGESAQAVPGAPGQAAPGAPAQTVSPSLPGHTGIPVASALPIQPLSNVLPKPVVTQPTTVKQGTDSSGLTLPTSPDQIGALEEFFFGSNYSSQSTPQRLSRLEMLLFGQPKDGADAQRLKNIIAAIPPRTKTSIDQSIAASTKAAATASQAPAAQGAGMLSGPAPGETAQPASPDDHGVFNAPITTVQTVQPGAQPAGAGQPATQIAAAQPTVMTPTNSAASVPGQQQQTQANAQAQVSSVFDGMQKLVKKYYPDAKITISGTKMHFEYKCKTEIGYYSEKKVYAPQEGGILGDISLKLGQYKGANKKLLPSDVPDGFHTNLTMAPYSSSLNEHLLTQMSYPPDVDYRFKGRFETIIDRFNAQDLAAQSANKEAARVARAENVAENKAGYKQEVHQAKVEAEATYAEAYGAPNMYQHNFPEGQFRVMFPNRYTTNIGTQIGLSDTTYTAQGVGGTFSVSFLQLPSLPKDGAATNALFDQISSILIKQLNGINVTQAFTSLNGSPGRQINIGSISGKPGYGAIIKLYVADETTTNTSETDTTTTSGYPGYPGTVTTTTTSTGKPTTVAPCYMLYEVSAVGEQQWLSSPAVADKGKFFDSFQPGQAQPKTHNYNANNYNANNIPQYTDDNSGTFVDNGQVVQHMPNGDIVPVPGQ